MPRQGKFLLGTATTERRSATGFAATSGKAICFTTSTARHTNSLSRRNVGAPFPRRRRQKFEQQSNEGTKWNRNVVALFLGCSMEIISPPRRGVHLDTVAVWLPLPARHERGEGWGGGILICKVAFRRPQRPRHRRTPPSDCAENGGSVKAAPSPPVTYFQNNFASGAAVCANLR